MPRTLAPCGTMTAYNRHLRRKEPTCKLCREANLAHVKEWREKYPERWKETYTKNNKKQWERLKNKKKEGV